MIIDQNSSINIITGNNGSGKSSILAEISNEEFAVGQNVICLSNTSTNKFPKRRSQRFHVLNQSSNTLNKAIKKVVISNGHDKIRTSHAHTFPRVLQYLEFEEQLTFKFTVFPYESFIRKFQSETYNNEWIRNDIEEITNNLNKLIKINDDINYQSDREIKSSHILYLEYSFTYEADKRIKTIHNILIELILKHERLLKKHHLISDIEINFHRGHNIIPSSHLSSGEAGYIATLAFILTHVSDSNTIIIDEPENSLHPRWQKKYTSNLLDLLYYFNVRIILATHSPMIVIGAVEDNSSLRVFKSENSILYPLEGNETNIDEVMVDVFGVLTSRSRYFSYKINEILNEFNNKTINLATAQQKLDKTLSLGPDENQENIIKAAYKILDEMSKNA
ncbi:AAA family ATPase [Klebsiella quasipneumoniae]|uniref:AAA family ATPase n=1 Tax=Klebsiella quasipneumoniae TaxID=1463165 RepID=UPI0024075EB3|nr:AAA family ATPase [Klebsiella quasipneumoniae]EIY4979209.1 ATP-binding protein [Klebsiella quasipneumoniae]MDG0509478.1 ATP-binding protein [Klebsiella quasipneumoniae]MDG0522849.1 ATP-binding protein [Klebsiella quasipneumoniae]